TGQMHPLGSPGSEKVAWWKGTAVKGGRSRSPAKTHPYGKATRITGPLGSWVVGPRLAAEVVGAMMGEQQQAPGAKDLWARVAQATEGSESLAIWPNSSRGDAVLGLDREKGPIRRLSEGGGQPASGQLQGRGARQPDWPGSGNAAADRP